MRFDMTLAMLTRGIFAIEPNVASTIMDGINAGSADYKEQPYDAVTYQQIGSLAIIDVDGAMHKKNLAGMCTGGIASYDTMIEYHKRAEADNTVSRILYHVDTPGGDVAGADRARDVIKNSTKPVDVFAENLLASAGMWIFSAADNIYASETTILGSIGVLVAYQDKETDVKYIVSSNAPNKYCDIKDENCKSKIQGRLDEYEAIFYDRLTASFGKEKEVIARDFDNGATIFATQAHKLGYVKEVLSFDAYLNRQDTPPAKSVNPKGGNGEKSEGVSMKQKEQIETLQSEMAATTEKVASLTAELEQANTGAETQREIAKKAVALGGEMGVSTDTIISAMDADTVQVCENIILKEAATTGAIVISASASDDKAENKYAAHANKRKGAVR